MHFTCSAQKLKRVAIALSTALSISMVSMSATITAAEFSPNFKGTDMVEFINIVGKNLKKTIIIDPQVRGKVDVRSYDLVDEEAYYQLFLSVLEVHKFAVVDMGNNVLKVVRAKDAKTSAIPVVEAEGIVKGDEMATRVLQLKNATVRELAPLLRQLTDQAGAGNVVPYEPTNVLLITSTASVVDRMVKIVQLVDKAGNKEVEIIKLKYASASEIVRIIENMNKSNGGNKSNDPLYLIPSIVSDDRTNSVIISGEAEAREDVVKLVKRLDSELESSGNTRVHYLKYSKAEDVAKVLQGVSKTIAADQNGNKAAQGQNSANKTSIEAHKDTNSLIITAEPDMMRSLDTVIRQLDVRRAQVLVEAIIVEIFETDGIQLGVQWFSEKGGFTQFNNGIAPISQVGGAYAAAQPSDAGSTTVINDNGVPITTNNPQKNADYTLLAKLLGTVNGTMFGLMNKDWGAIVQAVSSDVNSNILATPSITTLDNQEAYFIVGQEVPIITGSSTGSNNSNPFQTVDRQEVGIKLKVTPQVNEGGGVQLMIEQEVSSVSGTTGVDIAINKREIKTTVMVDNGDTIVLGGLIDEDVQESEQKVPLLGDIPILGHLFKSTGTTTRKRNLMVFIKPTIVRDGKVMQELSKEKYNFIRAQEIRKQEDGLSLMNDEKLPILPQWNDQLALPPSFDEYMDKREKDKTEQAKDKN